jgi:hypothetical protein
MKASRKREIRNKYFNKKFLIGPKSSIPKSITEKLVSIGGCHD